MQKLTKDALVDGRYKIVGRLGSGGMADVFCAEDTHLGRKVALKVLHQRFAQDTEFVERFRREASAAAGLQHPNVVGVFDRGTYEDTYYIAMEYVEGESLKEKIAGGVPFEDAIDYVRQILAAARFAHKRGIVHRDLKPHNVMVDPEARAKVADFGIARAGTSEMTQTGSIMGTAQYLSPEQAQGLPVTAASDLYSIGVILYEALTGKVPFDGDSAVAVALKQVSEVPAPPSSVNPAVPRALDGVVMRALAKDPADRYADADDFLADLEYAAANPGASGQSTAAFNAIPAGAAGPAAPAPLDQTQVRMPVPVETPPQNGSEAPPRRKSRGRRWVVVLLFALIAAAAIWAMTRPAMVTVPSVIGQQADRATRLLESRRLDVNLRTVRNDNERDTVLEQDPPPGRRIEEGATVILTVSAGPGTADVPDVSGLTRKEATRRLERADFQVAVDRRFSEDVESGKVIGTDPRSGIEVRRGSEITLLVSKGVETVALPNVVGMNQSAAESALREVGLSATVRERDADEPEGEVVAQDPAAGSRAERGSSVTIHVSTGEGSIEVADVVGRSRRMATDTLHDQGLFVSYRTQSVTQPSSDGIVLEQSIPAGDKVKKGTRVTLTMGRFDPPSDLGDEG